MKEIKIDNANNNVVYSVAKSTKDLITSTANQKILGFVLYFQ